MSEFARSVQSLRREVQAVTRGSDLPESLYDYTNQAWVVEGRYIRCGHPDVCSCYGTAHAGQVADMDRIRQENR